MTFYHFHVLYKKISAVFTHWINRNQELCHRRRNGNTVNVLARQKGILNSVLNQPRFFLLDLESFHVKKIMSHDTVPSADLESLSFPFRNTYFSSVSDPYLFDTDMDLDPNTAF